MALTDRQTEALDFIKGFSAQKGYPPSVAEVASGLDTCRSNAHRLLDLLAQKGAIIKRRRVHRSIRVTK
jgi:repressor LexA